MPLFLTSVSFAGLGQWLESHDADERIVLVTNASRQLADGEVVVALAEAGLADEGLRASRVDVLKDGIPALVSASAIVLAGGDPFLLLADLRAGGADTALADAHRRGILWSARARAPSCWGRAWNPLAWPARFPRPRIST